MTKRHTHRRHRAAALDTAGVRMLDTVDIHIHAPTHLGAPDTGGSCCAGAAINGPEFCTCWTPVFDIAQTDPDPTIIATARPTPCDDCAYRPGSPERTQTEQGDVFAAYDADDLELLVTSGRPFACHKGIRRPTHWVHPTGAVMPASSCNYQPATVNGYPYKADGTPADLCAGWFTRRVAYLSLSRRSHADDPTSIVDAAPARDEFADLALAMAARGPMIRTSTGYRPDVGGLLWATFTIWTLRDGHQVEHVWNTYPNEHAARTAAVLVAGKYRDAAAELGMLTLDGTGQGLHL